MTLFTLLIVMALERVTTKTKELHIATWMAYYFARLQKTNLLSSQSSIGTSIIIAGALALLAWLFDAYLPGLLVFLLHLLLLWVCLGCPVTRRTYKRYLQAANREDFEACSLYSEQFGNQGGDLSNVGKQLVLVNYRQYASVIIFYVLLGLPGMVFYSVIKELVVMRRREQQVYLEQLAAIDKQEAIAKDAEAEFDSTQDNGKAYVNSATPEGSSKPSDTNLLGSEKLLFILDWIPVRVTSLGYLLVGHFGKGLPVWVDTLFDNKLPTYDLLAKVARASEDTYPGGNPFLDEPLQLVKLVKRNIVFLLMLVSLATMVGVVA